MAVIIAKMKMKMDDVNGCGHPTQRYKNSFVEYIDPFAFIDNEGVPQAGYHDAVGGVADVSRTNASQTMVNNFPWFY